MAKRSAEKQQRLLRRLRSPDEAVRVHAALRLAANDISDVLPSLREALDDPDAHVRKLAAWVLARQAA